ncbi:MAG TPA: hypothetical protein VND45_04320 [Thermoanaerobaculia bacterium]|nr:hypothetical protein [Thermoanaerobaculia bacterium]
MLHLRDPAPRPHERVGTHEVDDPFHLLLAANYLPPFYTHTPLVNGERYGDGGVTVNAPYELAFAHGSTRWSSCR